MGLTGACCVVLMKAEIRSERYEAGNGEVLYTFGVDSNFQHLDGQGLIFEHSPDGVNVGMNGLLMERAPSSSCTNVLGALPHVTPGTRKHRNAIMPLFFLSTTWMRVYLPSRA